MAMPYSYKVKHLKEICCYSYIVHLKHNHVLYIRQKLVLMVYHHIIRIRISNDVISKSHKQMLITDLLQTYKAYIIL